MKHRARTPDEQTGSVPGRSCSATHTFEPCLGQLVLVQSKSVLTRPYYLL